MRKSHLACATLAALTLGCAKVETTIAHKNEEVLVTYKQSIFSDDYVFMTFPSGDKLECMHSHGFSFPYRTLVQVEGKWNRASSLELDKLCNVAYNAGSNKLTDDLHKDDKEYAEDFLSRN